jgi:hypothetical protein
MAKVAAHRIKNYKELLLSEIIHNEAIVEAIGDKSITDYLSQGDTLIGKSIHPMLHVPTQQDKAKVHICVDVDIVGINRKNTAFHEVKIIFWVMAHNDTIHWLEKGCSRIDFISDEIKTMLQDSLKYGFGILNLTSNKTHLLNPNYQYRQMEFKTVDAKSPFC